MCSLPQFLPPLLELNGSWERALEMLYGVFKKDFIEQPLFYDSSRVGWDRRIGDDNKEATFWHLITREDPQMGRIPDYKRARRLHWTRPTIMNHTNVEVKEWNYLEGSRRTRKYLWLEDYDFCVVLEIARKTAALILVTAFYVEKGKRRDLEGRYQKRV